MKNFNFGCIVFDLLEVLQILRFLLIEDRRSGLLERNFDFYCHSIIRIYKQMAYRIMIHKVPILFYVQITYLMTEHLYYIWFCIQKV